MTPQKREELTESSASPHSQHLELSPFRENEDEGQIPMYGSGLDLTGLPRPEGCKSGSLPKTPHVEPFEGDLDWH